MPSLAQLRRYAVGRTLFRPTTLPAAVARLGFVQADPIRAPARAQDLILRHRVAGYRAGDLEARYPRLALEEDGFVNYGYLPRATAALMHPRRPRWDWSAADLHRAREVLDFVVRRGTVHPAEVDAHFQHGTARNWFGGSSRVTTQLLDAMHYRGLLRVAGRRGGTRLYEASGRAAALLADLEATTDPAGPTPRDPGAPRPRDDAAHPDHARTDPAAHPLDRLVDVAVGLYAPLTTSGLRSLVSMLRYGAPQWADERPAAARRAIARLATATVAGVTWHWPAGDDPTRRWATRPVVRLLAPFDPIVWDRERFRLLWGWDYRFEAYTPAARRVRGYYALPLLWRDQVIGWGNVSVVDGRLVADLGYVATRPTDPAYEVALAAELDRMATFLGVAGPAR